MPRYIVDTDQRSCLDLNENQQFHLDAIMDHKSMKDGPVLKQNIRDVSNDSLIRERPINAQEENQELAMLCSKPVAVEEVDIRFLFVIT